MSSKLQAPKGTKDLLPGESGKWQHVERIAREVARLYNFAEVRTPVFEDTALFHRGVGETTDVVSKETYTFDSRGGDSLTLRPEGTAPVVRALLEAGLLDQQGATAKVYYVGTPVLRYERPQKGRLRQHHQFGVEAFGIPEPEQDVECILLQADFYKRVGLTGVKLDVNTLGDKESKQKYAAALRDYFGQSKDQLSPESQQRLETNPLRILDSKDPRDVPFKANAPANRDYLSDRSREHFDRVQQLLSDRDVAYHLEPNLVRGLDYYTDTLWEFTAEGLGAQAAVGGGGRYDNLVETLGGRAVPGVGFGMGMERLMLALEAQGVSTGDDRKALRWVIYTSETKNEALTLLAALRFAGLAADADLSGRSFKAQMKLADRAAATHALILGPDELAAENVTVKDLQTGQQEQVARATLVEHLARHDGEGGPH